MKGQKEHKEEESLVTNERWNREMRGKSRESIVKIKQVGGEKGGERNQIDRENNLRDVQIASC